MRAINSEHGVYPAPRPTLSFGQVPSARSQCLLTVRWGRPPGAIIHALTEVRVPVEVRHHGTRICSLVLRLKGVMVPHPVLTRVQRGADGVQHGIGRYHRDALAAPILVWVPLAPCAARPHKRLEGLPPAAYRGVHGQLSTHDSGVPTAACGRLRRRRFGALWPWAPPAGCQAAAPRGLPGR